MQLQSVSCLPYLQPTLEQILHPAEQLGLTAGIDEVDATAHRQLQGPRLVAEIVREIQRAAGQIDAACSHITVDSNAHRNDM